MHTPQTRGVVFRHPLRSATICITLLLTLFLSCQNPAGPSTDGSPDDGTTDGGTNTPVIDDEPGTGGGGGSGGSTGGDSSTGDVAPEPITITFVLDMVIDAGNGVSLSTAHSAPAPISVTAGEPVRLTQGMGMTATGPMLTGGTGTYHASGWSEENYSSQFPKVFHTHQTYEAPSGPGYYLPGFEATFTEHTTLYIRWLPELDNIAAQVMYYEPGDSSNTTAGPIVHVRDELPFETTAQFTQRVSPSWTLPGNEGIYSWQSDERSEYQPSV